MSFSFFWVQNQSFKTKTLYLDSGYDTLFISMWVDDWREVWILSVQIRNFTVGLVNVKRSTGEDHWEVLSVMWHEHSVRIEIERWLLVEMLVAMPEGLSSVSGTHGTGGEHQSQNIFWSPHRHCGMHLLIGRTHKHE